MRWICPKAFTCKRILRNDIGTFTCLHKNPHDEHKDASYCKEGMCEGKEISCVPIEDNFIKEEEMIL